MSGSINDENFLMIVFHVSNAGVKIRGGAYSDYFKRNKIENVGLRGYRKLKEGK